MGPVVRWLEDTREYELRFVPTAPLVSTPTFQGRINTACCIGRAFFSLLLQFSFFVLCRSASLRSKLTTQFDGCAKLLPVCGVRYVLRGGLVVRGSGKTATPASLQSLQFLSLSSSSQLFECALLQDSCSNYPTLARSGFHSKITAKPGIPPSQQPTKAELRRPTRRAVETTSPVSRTSRARCVQKRRTLWTVP